LGTRRNHQIVLARRPTGAVSEACFESTVRDVPELGEGEALLQVRYLGIDPTIRGWLDERGNYMAGVAIGECVRSNGVGVVVETNNPEEYPLGRAFMHLTGWQEYCVVQSNPFPPITMLPEDVELTDVLGVLGHIGITAYVGVLEVAKPQPGETFLVSAAASGVGSIAGQIARMQGARVFGIAGSAEKLAGFKPGEGDVDTPRGGGPFPHAAAAEAPDVEATKQADGAIPLPARAEATAKPRGRAHA